MIKAMVQVIIKTTIKVMIKIMARIKIMIKTAIKAMFKAVVKTMTIVRIKAVIKVTIKAMLLLSRKKCKFSTLSLSCLWRRYWSRDLCSWAPDQRGFGLRWEEIQGGEACGLRAEVTPEEAVGQPNFVLCIQLTNQIWTEIRSLYQ